MKNIFLTAILLCLTGSVRANTIELHIQSPHYETLELLFYTETLGRPLPIDALGLQEGDRKEYRGTCLSYVGSPTPDSIIIELLANRKCTSLGKIFESEMGQATSCTPAAIAVTTNDGYPKQESANAIRVVAYNGGVYIIHEKIPLVPRVPSVYCSYPAAQEE